MFEGARASDMPLVVVPQRVLYPKSLETLGMPFARRRKRKGTQADYKPTDR